jgi:hypothetical protein
MRHTRALATTLGMVLVLLLCFLPAVIGCDALSTLGLVDVLGAVALACFAVAGAAARPRGRVWLGASLGAVLYLLPGVLIATFSTRLGASLGAGSYLLPQVLGAPFFSGWTEDTLWYLPRLLLWWPSIPVAMESCRV